MGRTGEVKPEEMSCKDLADKIVDNDLMKSSFTMEAAQRLRKMDAMEMALNLEVGMNKVAAKSSVRLKRRVSLAEETLEMIDEIKFDTFKDIGNLRDNIRAMIQSWRFKVMKEGLKSE